MSDYSDHIKINHHSYLLLCRMVRLYNKRLKLKIDGTHAKLIGDIKTICKKWYPKTNPSKIKTRCKNLKDHHLITYREENDSFVGIRLTDDGINYHQQVTEQKISKVFSAISKLWSPLPW